MAEVIENPTAVPPDPVLRLSVEQYHSMIQSGILTEDDSVELLEGWLILKMPKNPAHSAVTRLIRQALGKAIPDGWYVDTQESITTIDSDLSRMFLLCEAMLEIILNVIPVRKI